MTTERFHLGRSVRDLTGLFKQTMPFQSVPEPLLKTLVALSRSVRYEKGQLIYDIGDPAEDLYIVYLGEVEVIFPPGGELENLSRAMRSRSVFGWDALFKKTIDRALLSFGARKGERRSRAHAYQCRRNGELVRRRLCGLPHYDGPICFHDRTRIFDAGSVDRSR